MRRSLPIIVGTLLVTLAGCTNPPAPAARTAPDPIARDPHHPRIPPENVRDVMQAKLAHAHAVLEGLALEDFEQVEINALELEALSRKAGWRVHTTVAYGVLSDEFGAIAADLAANARVRNLPAATRSYEQLTASCVACHTFLRKEGLYRDVPGAVSSARTDPGAL